MDLRCVQKNIVLKSGVAGELDVDRSQYVGEPKHSPPGFETLGSHCLNGPLIKLECVI